jgi:hypothetical protein
LSDFFKGVVAGSYVDVRLPPRRPGFVSRPRNVSLREGPLACNGDDLGIRNVLFPLLTPSKQKFWTFLKSPSAYTQYKQNIIILTIRMSYI